jgi:uncharacterized membrane protein YphA (DoxX/SURF4 family)
MKSATTHAVHQIGLQLLRIVTGTYFMAVALELVHGLDPAALFRPLLPAHVAGAIGATLLLSLSFWFMLGKAARQAALSLALFVLCTSFMTNFVVAPVENVSAFWYDLTLACAVLVGYFTLDERELRRAAILAHRARMRRIAAQRRITPRRVTPASSTPKPAMATRRPEAEPEIAF